MPKSKTNRTDKRLRDPELMRLRALRVIERRITGHSIKEIGEEFNVSEQTIVNILTYAKRAGLVADAEDKILQELVPAAHQAIKDALAEGDAKIAIEIFKGVLPGFSKSKQPSPTVTSGDDDLAAYIDRLRNGNGVIDGQIESPKQIEGDVAPTATGTESQGLLSSALIEPNRSDDDAK